MVLNINFGRVHYVMICETYHIPNESNYIVDNIISPNNDKPKDDDDKDNGDNDDNNKVKVLF